MDKTTDSQKIDSLQRQVQDLQSMVQQLLHVFGQSPEDPAVKRRKRFSSDSYQFNFEDFKLDSPVRSSTSASQLSNITEAQEET